MTGFRSLSYDSAICPVRSIQFATLSPKQIRRRSVVEVTTTESYHGMDPIAGGLFDSRMGTTEHSRRCATCNGSVHECTGHPGHIELAVPVFSIAFHETVRKILRCVCWRCGRLLVSPEHPDMVQAMRAKGQRRFDAVYAVLTKSATVRRCGNHNPSGCGAMQPARMAKSSDKFMTVTFDLLFSGVSEEEGGRGGAGSSPDGARDHKVVLGAPEVRRILERIPDSDVAAMGFSPRHSRPEWFVLEALPVPPPCVRPSARNEMGQRSEDDLTVALQSIMKYNALVRKKLGSAAGGTLPPSDPYVQLLQFHCATLVNNQIPDMARATQRTGRSIVSITERLKAKEGRVRGNLLGKRVDYSARTVITPDPCISIDEVGVPLRIATVITFPEVAGRHNRERLQAAVDRGPSVYPGARFLQKRGGGPLKQIRAPEEQGMRGPPEVEEGDTVHRHMRDGDYVLLNRQPSLWRGSMMAHRVRVMPHATFRLNACVTPSFNADFDGDEMNIHAPISPFTMCEIASLASVPTQILTPKSSAPIVSVVQDVALGVHEMTKGSVRVPRRLMHCMAAQVPQLDLRRIDPTAAFTSGRDALSLALPPVVNARVPGAGGGAVVEHGRITEGTLNVGSYQAMSTGLVHSVYNELGMKATVDLFDATQRSVCEWFTHTGFTVGMGDLVVDAAATSEVAAKLDSSRGEVSDIISAMHRGGGWKEGAGLAGSPAMNFEGRVNGLLNKARKDAEKIAEENVPASNRMARMIAAGSKGKSLNIVQMVGTLGQQNVDGKRVQHGFEGRVLPHSTRYDDGADARGFVSSSFASGLNPQEFVFHSMGGRVGLIDTAVRTSECGYISRKLIKAMEDAKIHHDGTVRNAVGHVLQGLYGEDGFDSTSIERHAVEYSGWGAEKMTEGYLLTEHHPPAEWMTERARRAWLEDPRHERLGAHFRDVLADQEYLRSLRSGDAVLFPVAVKRILTNAIARQRADRPAGYPSDLDPHRALDELERLLRELVPVPGAPQSPIFAAVLRMHLSPKPLLALGCTAATHAAVVEAVAARYADALAQPGEMVGVVAAQSIGEPTTQLTLNSVAGDTEVPVCQGGVLKSVRIAELVDPYLPAVRDPLHQNDWAEVADLRCVSLSPREQARWSTVTHVSRHPSHNQMISIRTASGREVTATKGHSFLMRKDHRVERVPGAELRVGDAMPIVRDLPEIGPAGVSAPDAPVPLTFATGRFVGAVLSEAVLLSDGAVCFHRDDERWARSVAGTEAPPRASPPETGGPETGGPETGGPETGGPETVAFSRHAPFVRWTEEHFGSAGQEKKLPGWILAAPKEFVRGLLLAAFDGGGAAPGPPDGLGFRAASDALRTMLGLALGRFGIPVHHTAATPAGDGRRRSIVSVPTAYAERFRAEIGATRAMEAARDSDRPPTSPRGAGGPVPMPADTIGEMIEAARAGGGPGGGGGGGGALEAALRAAGEAGAVAPELLERCRDACSRWEDAPAGLIERIEQALAADCIWDPIVAIAPARSEGQMVYDLTVDGDHTFTLSSALAVGNTFHMAGVASASQATQGLPRIRELFNMSKNPKQVILKVYHRVSAAAPAAALADPAPDTDGAVSTGALGAVQNLRNDLQTTLLRDVLVRSRMYFDPDDFDTRIPEDRRLVEAYRAVRGENCQTAAQPWVVRLELDRAAMLEHDVTMADVADAIDASYGDSVECLYSDDAADDLVFRVRLTGASIDTQRAPRPAPPQGARDAPNDDGVQAGGAGDAGNPGDPPSPPSAEDAADILTHARAMESVMAETVMLKGDPGIRAANPEKLKIPGTPPAQHPWVLICAADPGAFQRVLAHPDVDASRTTSNFILDIYATLGIEAARTALYREINEQFESKGLNPRHLLLLVDTMTARGKLQSIDRHGINRGEAGPLSRASFEESADMLKNAGSFAEVDRCNSVSASIMLGQLSRCGTGDVGVVLDPRHLPETVAVVHPVTPADPEWASDLGLKGDALCSAVLSFAYREANALAMAGAVPAENPPLAVSARG